ncbi:NfeD family protein [Peptococcus simiae]|uniref:NfeD family protein n=1 Tax=Peptococcus simiae TaxID=1643805 RepID=A0ABW9H1G0_9FIRM
MDFLPIAFFVLGIILILVEVFVPGFGVFGLAGAACILLAVYLTEGNLKAALPKMAITVVVMAVLSPLVVQLMKRSRRMAKFNLQESLTTEEGFVSTGKRLSAYIGHQGRALTDLRPAGTMVTAEDERLDVTTRGDFIAKGSLVEVVAAEGTWLIVKNAEE